MYNFGLTVDLKFFVLIVLLIISSLNYFYLRNNFYEKLKNDNILACNISTYDR